MKIGIAMRTDEIKLINKSLPRSARNIANELQLIYDQIDALDLQKDSDLTQEQIRKLRLFLKVNAHVFLPNPKGPTRTPRIKHSIRTGDHPPIKQRGYRLSPAENEYIAKEVQKMEKNKVVRKSSSSWLVPVVLTKKKDGTLRFCTDYRKLNNVTKKDVYPLPRIDETLEKMRGMKYFTSLDLASGYWQVEIEEKDKEKTAFSCSLGLFEWNVMPFGLTNAPATFQRLMDEVILGIDWDIGADYMDDLIIGSLSFEEHLNHLQKVFDRLTEYGLTIKLQKCTWCKHKLHEISHDGIGPNPSKTDAINKMQPPMNVQGLKRFLGMTGFYRRFIRHYATIADPLNKLLRKDSLWRWDEACQEAFNILKQKLQSAPILAYPDFSKPFTLHTDASIIGLKAVLCQEQDGKEQVIAYASRSVTKEERKWGITELECLAVDSD